MEDTLISLETAKLAKERGFDLLVDYFYLTLKDSQNGEVEVRTWSTPSNFNSPPPNPYIIEIREAYSAPTQSLLQKWLREVHKYCIFVNMYDDATYYYEVVWVYKKEAHSQSNYNGCFSTYEEALEDGLQNVLKSLEE